MPIRVINSTPGGGVSYFGREGADVKKSFREEIYSIALAAHRRVAGAMSMKTMFARGNEEPLKSLKAEL